MIERENEREGKRKARKKYCFSGKVTFPLPTGKCIAKYTCHISIGGIICNYVFTPMIPKLLTYASFSFFLCKNLNDKDLSSSQNGYFASVLLMFDLVPSSSASVLLSNC